MKKERENIDILRMHARMCVRTRVYASLGAELRYSQCSPAATQDRMFCEDCRYFQPDDELSLTVPWTDEALPGECRCNPPVVGDVILVGTDEEQRWFGNFPRVMASDWCGRLVVRDVGPRRGESSGASTDVGIEPNGHH